MREMQKHVRQMGEVGDKDERRTRWKAHVRYILELGENERHNDAMFLEPMPKFNSKSKLCTDRKPRVSLDATQVVSE